MITRTAAGAKTLPQTYYTSQEIFRREMDSIFSHRWLFAGHISRLARPGDFFLFEIDRESLILLRDAQSEVRGFYNVCRHRGARVCSASQGQFSHAIQCPYHAWTYGLDGRLIGAPIMNEVADFDRRDYPLRPVAVRVWEGLIFVNLAARPESFEEAFSPLIGKFDSWQIADLRPVHQTVYEVEANWKLLFQNYSECYHCPTVHPTLNKLTPFRDSSNDLDEGPFLGGPMHLATPGGSMTMTGARCAAPLGHVDGTDLDRVYYYTIFPNLFLSLHPDYVLVHRGDPRAVDRTTITSRAYSPGPYADLESQLAAFDREYLRSLDGPGADAEDK
jgi:Rieske 2Fe-2S family protein